MDRMGGTRNRQHVRAVIMDAGGVLLFPDLDWLCARFAEHGLSLIRDQLHLAYYGTICQLDLDRSMAKHGAAFTNLDTRVWFFGRMLQHAGVATDQAREPALAVAELAAERFPRESDIYHWTMPGLRGELEALQEAGFLLGAASNNDDALTAQLTSVGLVDLFGTLKDSGAEGVSKPDPELLWRAAEELDVDPGQCLYVGDVDRVDGRAARAAGMAFALLDPLGQPRATSPLIIPDLPGLLDHFKCV